MYVGRPAAADKHGRRVMQTSNPAWYEETAAYCMLFFYSPDYRDLTCLGRTGCSLRLGSDLTQGSTPETLPVKGNWAAAEPCCRAGG